MAKQNPSKKKRQVSCVDLFCGAGGLTHGLIKKNIKVTAGIDVDPACRFPYEANNEGARFIERDVSIVTPVEIKRLFLPGSIRVLAGCAPCQPFSKYRQGYDNENDEKWGLLYHFARLVTGVKPDIVTMENVPTVSRHSVFEDFVSELSAQNYHIWFKPVECTDYGVPQTRTRMVLLASRLGPIELVDKTVRKTRTVRDAIKSIQPIRAGQSAKRDRLHIASDLSDKNMKRIRASIPGGSWRDWPKHLVAKCHRETSGKNYVSVYGRMEWDKPAPTITTQCYGFGNGRFGHPSQSRAISLREAAILQSFPRRYKFVEKKDPIEFRTLGRLIGNAVPVKLGEAIGKSIMLHVNNIQ